MYRLQKIHIGFHVLLEYTNHMENKISITEAITQKEKLECFNIRFEVFVKEQGVPKEIEIDEFDRNSFHALARINNKTLGTGRLIYLDTENAKIGRMAVSLEYRKTGIGGLILDFLEKKATNMGVKNLTLNAQEYISKFYSKHGYYKKGVVFLEAGIPHMKMNKKI